MSIAVVLLVWKADDVALTDWTLLEVHQPFLKAVDVEDVLTERDFHKVLALLEVLQAESALPLVDHVGNTFGLLAFRISLNY